MGCCKKETVLLEILPEFFQTGTLGFCHPESDDLIVLPKDRHWALLYHHSEFMQYGLPR
jgi:hypothetical protein